jgi:hypothetical protein|tara:strand:- start:198 stop:410 length:213 start_codon:yes stop_codon:yes gene_type:complete
MNKTKFMEAVEGQIDYGSDLTNINKAIRKAKRIPIVDLIDMDGVVMGNVAEVLALLKSCNYLELMEGYEA